LGGTAPRGANVAGPAPAVLPARRCVLPLRPQGRRQLTWRPHGLSVRPPITGSALERWRSSRRASRIETRLEECMAMDLEHIASALERVASTLRRKPQAGLADDAAATARWAAGLRTQVHSDTGFSVPTDMPTVLGGEAAAMTPGWLLRAGLASCSATRIAMAAAAEGIALHTLEVRATSRSDARGLLAVPEADGGEVPAGPLEVVLHVRIGAPDVGEERLRALVASTATCSPVTAAVERPVPVAMHIEVAA
jgi:uncharacterized OsmC-like protein